MKGYKKALLIIIPILVLVFIGLTTDVIKDIMPMLTDENETVAEEHNGEEKLKYALKKSQEEVKKDSKEYLDDLVLINADVLRVVDGDTILVRIKSTNDTCKVRYIGIDTPESVHKDPLKNTEEGRIASKRNKEILNAAFNKVYLEYDTTHQDKYGRDLCYAYIKKNGEYIMVQDILLKEGMAKVMTVPPNVAHSKHFLQLQKTARNKKIGFWSGDIFN